MKRIYLLNPDAIEEFNKKVKIYNKLLAKKYFSGKENDKELEKNIKECKYYIGELLKENTFDYLDDVDISEIKDKFHEENTIRELLNRSYLNNEQVELLINKLKEEKEDYSKLISFLRISIKKNFALVMFYE